LSFLTDIIKITVFVQTVKHITERFIKYIYTIIIFIFQELTHMVPDTGIV